MSGVPRCVGTPCAKPPGFHGQRTARQFFVSRLIQQEWVAVWAEFRFPGPADYLAVVAHLEHGDFAAFAFDHGMEPKEPISRYQAFSTVDRAVGCLVGTVEVWDRICIASHITVAEDRDLSGIAGAHQLQQVTV